MKRLTANSCGYSGYICRGIPDIKHNGIYKALFKDLTLIPSALSSCGVYSLSASMLPYIWHNFGNLPTTVRIYDTDAKACLSLSVVGQSEKLLTCNIRYDRYSLEYFSVAATVGLKVPYVTLHQCYASGLTRLLHIPGILDPAHSTPDIQIPLIKVPTKTPKIADILIPDIDVDTRALNLGMIAGGRFTNALQLALLQACYSTLFKVTAALDTESTSTSSFTYKITVAAGTVLVLDDLTRSSVMSSDVDAYTQQVTVALGKSVTYYVYCRVDLSGLSISCRIEFKTDKRSRLLNSYYTAYVLIATVTIGCADRKAQDMLFKSIDARGTDTAAETTDVMTSAIALWNALLQALLDSDKGRCAVSITQHTCGTAKLLYSLLGIQDMLPNMLLSETYMGLTVACLDQAPRSLPIGPFNCTNTDDSKGGVVQLLQLLGLPNSPTAYSLPLHITNVGYMLNGILTVDGGKLVTVSSVDAELPKPPDAGLYVLGCINGSTTWIQLVPGDAPTFPN